VFFLFYRSLFLYSICTFVIEPNEKYLAPDKKSLYQVAAIAPHLFVSMMMQMMPMVWSSRMTLGLCLLCSLPAKKK